MDLEVHIAVEGISDPKVCGVASKLLRQKDMSILFQLWTLQMLGLALIPSTCKMLALGSEIKRPAEVAPESQTLFSLLTLLAG